MPTITPPSPYNPTHQATLTHRAGGPGPAREQLLFGLWGSAFGSRGTHLALPLSGLRSPDSPKHSSTLTAGRSPSGRLWGPWDHLLEACSNLGPLCSDLWGAPRLLTRSGSCHSPGPHLHQCYWPLAGHFLPLGQTPACTLRGRETVGRHRRRLSPQGARRPSPRPPGTPGTARSSRAPAGREPWRAILPKPLICSALLASRVTRAARGRWLR